MKTSAKEQFLLLAFITVLAIFLRVEPAAASTGVFQIIGYIRDNQGSPVGGIGLAVDDYVGDVFTGTSDADGYYLVEVEADSNYRVTLDCAQLTGRGFACVAPVALTVNDGGLELDFTLDPSNSPVQITNVTLPVGNVGAQYHAELGATGGKPPYHWILDQNTQLPNGLGMDSSGVISGVAMTNGVFACDFRVTDANSVTTDKAFSLSINPRPVLSAISCTNHEFSLWLAGASNQNYTIQANTNLNSSNWISLFVTNNPRANAFMVTAADATNQQCWYRVWIGP